MKNKWILTKHILIVILSFSIEVRVKADVGGAYSIDDQKGQIEVDKLNDGSTDIQTHKNAQLKVTFQGTSIGITENTFLSLSENAQLHFGSVFLQPKEAKPFSLNTKHGIILIEQQSAAIVHVSRVKTTVSVLLGQVKMNDRIQTNPVILSAGYQQSIGGLYAYGKKKWSSKEAFDEKYVIHNYNIFTDVDQLSKNITIDHIKIAWKKAVQQVALETQDQINHDLLILEAYEKKQYQRKVASENERKKIKAHFRAKVLGLPDQSKEAPLE